ncbi:gliding motility lipoprotein GldH [Peijinzhouia sedimentorum]
MNKGIYLILTLCLFTFFSCDANRHFEENQEMTELNWSEQNPVQFEVMIDDSTLDYNLIANIRNGLDYPYQNLYLQWQVADSLGNTIDTGLQNIDLFDARTGKPLNKGIGSISTNQKAFVEGFQFPYTGKFSIQLEQFMRVPNLKDVYSVGLRVEKAEPK